MRRPQVALPRSSRVASCGVPMLRLGTPPRLLAVLGAALLGLSCSKSKPTSAAPGPTGGNGGTGIQPAPMLLRYSPQAVALRQTSTVDFTTTGGGAYAQASLGVNTDVSLRGAGDAIEVRWKITGLENIKLGGALAGESDEAQQYLRRFGTGAWQLSPFGVVDLRATDAHPANARRLAALAEADALVAARSEAGEEDAHPPAGAALAKLLPELLRVPRLPAEPMRKGATHEIVETHDTALIGTDLVIPTETTLRFSLVRIAGDAGIRLAEIAFDFEDWGGLELAEGDVELKNRTEGTLLFDVDRGVPVSLNYTREESLVAGEISYDTTKIVAANFERL